ncbi:hypothetical protein F5B22DRAFT_52002 [Xylaria bambusicola]|uniref:uncharacterized protein n=1 Tax=Xylaria bambusicola TaxID=326684 RepID=UPI0020076A4D|nr:uncharacterized protein F5B22DRAFT_52002 [Xylaria bambusicola]KAI0520799.1 hypothetical protein F5B22DRAFT_52002 [Xylaria bambusicola]
MVIPVAVAVAVVERWSAYTCSTALGVTYLLQGPLASRNREIHTHDMGFIIFLYIISGLTLIPLTVKGIVPKKSITRPWTLLA